MRIKTLIQTILSFLCCTQLALADQGLSWEQVGEQDNWKPTTLQSLEHSGAFMDAWKTGSKTYRIESLPDTISGSMELKSDNRFNNTGYRRWKKQCRNVEDYTPYLIIENNHFQVNLGLHMVSFESSDWSPRESSSIRPRIENQPELQNLEISVQLKPGAVTEKVSSQLLPSANRHLNQQLSQMSIKDGKLNRLELDLTGMDAIACDLANEKATILIRGFYKYESAKAVAKAPLTKNQIRSAQQKAMKESLQTGDVTSRISGSVISLAYALEDHQSWHPKSAVRTWASRLSGGLIDFNTGQWVVPSEKQLKGLWGKIATWNYSNYDGVIDYEFPGGE